MKDHLLVLASGETDARARLNLVREYLQAHILRSFQEAGAFASLAFLSGTALRFLHGLRRFSEDIDFSLERPKQSLDLAVAVEKARRDFELAGHTVEATARATGTIHSAQVKFPGLLRDVGLTSDRRKKLMIRVEVDTRPPKGATMEQRLVTRHFPIVFRAYDLRSCMAGKLHAVLTRGHTKGRDLFDLAWFLTHPERPVPNLEFLRNALAQTGWTGPEPVEGTWRDIIADSLTLLDWDAVAQDVDPFLEDPRDRQLLERDLLVAELRRGRP